ncbi:cystatin A2 [Cavenderia fasciculata]|uniref:Cystatin A2 n=1 Tax=Cavenderia fasciculata TaxID=261658 RepID=F4PVL5_CACFS|nr:cystatin A2 [Cavenderia fasciculata]EGG20029.1 cystatin A2 [Cavenderia fasciculata]|eukprot:XP_004367012.1 cystatin A2 [Cavenderia fasciculata]
MALGGVSQEIKQADNEIREIVNKVKSEIAEKLGKTAEVEPISYKTQTVAGTNYFVKVKVADSFAHLRIYKDLSQAVSLHSVQDGKTSEDNIEYF